ncbi:unnamed protein product, partial [Staurois parvus]
MGPVRPPLLLSIHHHTLPCATFRSPHTAGGFNFVIGLLADYGLPLLLPAPVICHGPPYRHPQCCCQVQSVSWVPVQPPIAAVSNRHTLPCATFRSPHTAGGFHF